ncbi:hypothetical protein BRM3_14655 [Brachybacterium huguangmaarense]|uniref:Toxin n=1 Tax=Brachybacterium huguangmaarense TaxID=1652028 RepID=A0ABY6G6M4_9MICO|nr:hypothetical protein BRM3_14655 [Brachybacterium huguangmaarense]
MKVRPSALKHGIAAHESIHAASRSVYLAPLDEEDPQREFRLGFDQHARLLELVVLVWDDGTEEIIHAMRARTQYLDLLR